MLRLRWWNGMNAYIPVTFPSNSKFALRTMTWWVWNCVWQDHGIRRPGKRTTKGTQNQKLSIGWGTLSLAVHWRKSHQWQRLRVKLCQPNESLWGYPSYCASYNTKPRNVEISQPLKPIVGRLPRISRKIAIRRVPTYTCMWTAYRSIDSCLQRS